MAINAKLSYILAQLGCGLSIATTNCNQFDLLLPGTETSRGSGNFYQLDDKTGFKFHENGNAKSVFVDLVNTNRDSVDDLIAGFSLNGLKISNAGLLKTSEGDVTNYVSRFELSLTDFARFLKTYKTNKFAVGTQGVPGQCGEYLGSDGVSRMIFKIPTPTTTPVTDFKLAWYKHSEKDSNDASVLFVWEDDFNIITLMSYFSAKACRARRDGVQNDHLQNVGIDVSKLIETEIDGSLKFSSKGTNLKYVASVLLPKIQQISAQYDAGSAKLQTIAPTNQAAQQFVTPMMLDMSQDF